MSKSQDSKKKKKGPFKEQIEFAKDGEIYIKFRETKVDRYLTMYTE